MYFINLDYQGTPKYSFGRFCKYSDDLYDVITSYFLLKLKELPVKGYLIITPDLEYRPDLLSYQLYEDTQYWWLLLYYNDLVSFEDLKSGLQIKYFDLVDLESLYLSLKPLELAKND
jgi:hypothetical protein